MPSKNGMTSSWLDFEKKTMKHVTNPVQLDETMKAFKAGYFSCFVYLTTEVASLPEAKAMEAMKELENEVIGFTKDMLERALEETLSQRRKSL